MIRMGIGSRHYRPGTRLSLLIMGVREDGGYRVLWEGPTLWIEGIGRDHGACDNKDVLKGARGG